MPPQTSPSITACSTRSARSRASPPRGDFDDAAAVGQQHRRRLRRRGALGRRDASARRVRGSSPSARTISRRCGSGCCRGARSLITTTTTSPAVAIVSATLAQRFWPGQNPIGKRVKISYNKSGWRQIVGVVADVKGIDARRAGRRRCVRAVSADAVALHGGGGAHGRQRRRRSAARCARRFRRSIRCSRRRK